MKSAVLEVPMAKNNNRRSVEELFADLCAEFGNETGEKIINMIVAKWGGERLTIPDFEDLYILGRNRVIRKQRSNNVSITALMIEHDLSRCQILRICNDGDGE
jgi:hypothetical protein